VPHSYIQKNGYKLGLWVMTQRQQYRQKRLTKRRQKALEQLPGWFWNARKGITKSWLKSLEVLREYVKREGHARIPSDYVTENGYKLGAWITYQRHKCRNGKLHKEQEEALEQLPGWVWSARGNLGESVSEAWLKAFVRLGEYVEREGHSRVPQHCKTQDGFSLGKWVSEQRLAYRRTALSPDQKEALEQLPGWVWNAQKGRGKRMTESWLKGLDRLREYVEREGNAVVSQRYVTENGYKLGTWVRDQRYKHKKGRLSTQQEEALGELSGWVWNVQNGRDKGTSKEWVKGLDRLREYVAREGHARVPWNYITNDNYRLGAWVLRQRIAYRRGKLNAEQRKSLQKLVGWVWNARDSRWPAGLWRLRKFVKREGHALVPFNYVAENGHKLGKWVIKQRHLYRYGKLSAERQKALEQLAGWMWARNCRA